MVGGQIANACKQHEQARAAAAAKVATPAAEGTQNMGEAGAAATATTVAATTEGAQDAAAAAAAATAAVSTTVAASSGELKFAAVVDPPRSGVHAKCLRSIRSTKAIKRLVREGEARGCLC